MNTNEIRIACAEELGWSLLRNREDIVQPLMGLEPNGNDKHYKFLPDFTESLDACRLLLEAIKPEEWRPFCDLLWVEVGQFDLKSVDEIFTMLKALLLATPLQIATAFLKTKGKL